MSDMTHRSYTDEALPRRLAAAEAELAALQEARARRIRAGRAAFGAVLRCAPVAAVLAVAVWALGDGIDLRTTNTSVDKLRMSIETSGGVGVDADAGILDANLGVGTATPAYRLHVLRTVDPATVMIDGVGAVTPGFAGRRANGTPGALTAVASGDNLLVLGGYGYGSTAYSGARALLSLQANQAWTDAAQGTYVNFWTTPTGSTGALQRMRITHNGEVGINTTTPDALLDVEQLTAGALGPVVRLTGGGGGGAQVAYDFATFDPANGVPAARILGTDDGNFGAHVDVQTRDASNALQTRIRVATDGSVGFGTASPQTRLHVASNNAGAIATGVTIDEDGSANPRIELRGTAKTPYIDFNNDVAPDFDARWILVGDDELKLQDANLRLSNANWSGAFLDVSGGRSISLENNTGLGGSGGLRIWDQTSGTRIADFATDNTWTIEQGGTIKWSGGTGTNTLDFNKGASKIFDDAQMRIRTDDYVYIQNTGGGNLTSEITFRATNTNTTNDVIVGRYVGAGGVAPGWCLNANRSGGTVAIFDRTGSDGTIIALQQDGVSEGSISVSGTTVSYNAFTGSHYAWTPGGRTYERGTLVVATGENVTEGGWPFATGETVFGIATTSIPEDPRVLGAYLAPDFEHPERWHFVMAVGDGFLLVTDSNGDIGLGDFVTSSPRAGFGQRQSADRIMNYTVAKSMESVDWSKIPVDPKKGFRWKLIACTYKAG